MASAAEDPAAEVLRQRSARAFRLFSAYLDGYFARNFDAVRVLSPGLPALPPGEPVVFYTNHPSWWDPLLFMLLSSHLMPGRRGFGPMDAAALERYRFMRRLGVFGVEQDQAKGAKRFLRISRGLLREPDVALWMTPQGRFADMRERPITFRPGLGHLAAEGTWPFVPVAFEFTFWDERKPEALVAFGEPVRPGSGARRSSGECTAELERALAAAMDRLAAASLARSPAPFETLVAGRAAINPFYDGWRFIKAMLRGERYTAAHGGRR